MPDRQMTGLLSKRKGQFFETMVLEAARYYENKGIAVIEKTPEPMRILKPYDDKGRFVACFAKQAQPDFKGVLCDSTMVIFDAKSTDMDRIRREAVTEEQEECFDRYQLMGARCFLVITLRFEKYFRVPWNIFKNMKKIYGHKYMDENDLKEFEIKFRNGNILYLEGLELKE